MAAFIKKHKILILTLLFLIILSVMLLKFKNAIIKQTLPHSQRDLYKVIALGNKAKIITFNGSGKTFIEEYDYPKPDYKFHDWNDHHDYLMPLFKETGKNNFLFPLKYKKNSEKRYLIQKFSLDQVDRLDIETVFDGTIPAIIYDHSRYFVDYDFRKKGFYFHRGMIATKKGHSFVKNRIDDHELLNFFGQDILAVGYLSDDLIIIQATGGLYDGHFPPYYDLMDNHILIYSIRNDKIVRNIQFGYCPVDQAGSTYYHEFKFPMMLNKSGVLYFTARHKESSKPEIKDDPAPLWLCSYDVRTNKAEKIVKIKNAGSSMQIFGTESMNQFKNDQTNLITFSSINQKLNEKSTGSNMTYNSMIIDVNKKKIIKQFPWGAKSMRWSPDGKYLGMLRIRNYYTGEIEDKHGGELYVYNLESDKLFKIDHDNTLIDFQWVE